MLKKQSGRKSGKKKTEKKNSGFSVNGFKTDSQKGLGAWCRIQIAQAFKKIRRRKGVPQTAQQTLGYEEIYRDGICHVTDRTFSKTIEFFDITYQLAQDEDKNIIFENWCDFLNYFDSSIHVELSFINQTGGMEERMRSLSIPEQNDDFDSVRREYGDMLKSQMAKGNNGLKKSKYITFSIEADSRKAAKQRLERIENDVLNHFKAMGVKARSLNGLERLKLLHQILRQGNSGEKFSFQWDTVSQTGMTSRDMVAPDSFRFNEMRRFQFGRTLGSVSFLQILAPELTDRMLADFLDVEGSLVLTMHIQSIDQTQAIKTVKHKLSDLDKMKVEEQRKAVRSGYDMLRPDRV